MNPREDLSPGAIVLVILSIPTASVSGFSDSLHQSNTKQGKFSMARLNNGLSITSLLKKCRHGQAIVVTCLRENSIFGLVKNAPSESHGKELKIGFGPSKEVQFVKGQERKGHF
jgi:hypothetical protein